MPRTFWLALGLALTPLPGARAGVPVRPAPGKQLPSQIEYLKNNVEPLVYVAYKGAKPIDYPDENRKEVPFTRDGKPATIDFLEPLFAADQTQADRTQYLLLVRKDPAKDSRKIADYVGWFDIRHLVVTPEALKHDLSQIHRKAIIVTRPRGLKGAGADKVSAVPVYLAPDVNAEQAAPLRLLRLLFLYGDSDPDSKDPDAGFYLVGTASRFVGVRNRHVVLGWVPKTRICVWDTREAFEWHTASRLATAPIRRARPARIFAEPEHVHDDWRGGAAKTREGRSPVLFTEITDAGPMPPEQLRFLLLPWPSASKADREKKQLYQSIPRSGDRGPVPVHHVGVYGGFVSSDNDEVVLDPQRLENLKRTLSQIKDEASRMEVVFVIDGTSSMGPHARAVAEVFDELLETLRGEPVELRLAVTFYKDVEKEGTDPDTVVTAAPLKDFRVGAPEYARLIRDWDFSGGGDPEEQVFRGLRKGIEAAKFSRYARKVVVLLGDYGNNTAWDAKFPGPTVADLANQLNPQRRSPIEFYAVQVIDPKSDSFTFERSKKAAKAFEQEARAILANSQKLLADRKLTGGKYGRTAGAYFTRKETGRLKELLLARFRSLRQQQEEVGHQINELLLGRFTAEIGPELVQILKDQGVDVNWLRSLKGAQVFETGYVAAEDAAGAPQLARKILLSGGQLGLLAERLKQLEDADPARRSLRDALVAVVKNQAGQDDLTKLPDRSVADVLFSHLKGLTFKRKFLETAVANFHADRVPEQALYDLLRLKMLYEDLQEGVRYRYALETETVAGLRLETWKRVGEPVRLDGSAPDRMRRFFYINDDKTARWYWIDFDTEWP